MILQPTPGVERSNFAFELETILPIVMAELEAALVSGRYILSWEVERFEAAFAEYVGTSHALGVNSGTDALTLALQALDVGPGDEVVTVANTFHATALAIARVGARPVFVDARSDDFLMDLTQVDAAISPRTKAIVAVHLFGLAMELEPLLRLCRARSLYLVEDCAQATGAMIAGRRVGSIGDVGCFSFHPSKTLAAAGDAGAVTTSHADLADRIRSLRYFGQRERKVHSELGHNSKLDAFQAIVLFHKLPLLDAWNTRRRERAKNLMGALADLPIRFQAEGLNERHVIHLLQLDCSEQRDALLKCLAGRNIDAVVRYSVPLHLQPAFRGLGYTAGAFPVAERLASTTLCLPLRPDLSERETREMTEVIAEHFGV